MRTVFSIIPLSLLLAGCASDYTADKLGVTDQQKAIDLYQCAGSTGDTVNVVSNPNEPTGMSTDDLLAGAMVMDCMRARGYTITAK